MSRIDAELGRSVLEAAGIPVYVSGDDLGGMHPEIPFGIGGTAVVVPDDRYQEACAILDAELGGAGLTEEELAIAAMDAGDRVRAHGVETQGETQPEDEVSVYGVSRGQRSGRFRVAALLVAVMMLGAALSVAIRQVLG